jgi:hypothetical protein
MRASCCKDWLATAWRILNAVTHTDIISFGYMTACPNLVSVKITSVVFQIYKNLYIFTFPNIRTLEYVEYDTYLSARWYAIMGSCPNFENIVITYTCTDSTLYGNTIVRWLLEYPQFKKLTIQNVSIYINRNSTLLDCSILITLINCEIYLWGTLPATHNLTMLNCTIIP